MIEKQKPEPVISEIPTNPIWKFVYRLITHKMFDLAIIVVILLNIMIMGLKYNGMSSTF